MDYLTFDDVLILPKFSDVGSRRDVDLSSELGKIKLTLPVISANMNTITEIEMARAMRSQGGVGAIHRFDSAANLLKKSRDLDFDPNESMWSFGLGDLEIDRLCLLYEAGVRHFILDVAHGAQKAVAEQYIKAKNLCPNTFIVVGNFATGVTVRQFISHIGRHDLDAVKVGIGPGSACLTRVKTGVGVPQLSAIENVVNSLKDLDIKVIADGGLKTPGDIAKALAAGAHAVMIGGMLAGTAETPGSIVETNQGLVKTYKGSASQESYLEQNKSSDWRTAEGEAFVVPYVGSASVVLKDIEGGLRSAFTYVGAKSLSDFHRNAKLIQVTQSTRIENSAHWGKK